MRSTPRAAPAAVVRPRTRRPGSVVARAARRLIPLAVCILGWAGRVFAAAEPALERHPTEHFVFLYEPGAEALVAPLAQNAEAVRLRVCRELALPCFQGPIEVRLARSEEEFRAALPGRDTPVDNVVGVAYPTANRIVLRADAKGLFTLAETFEHEVSHIAVQRGVGRTRLPRWFLEGLALHQAGQPLAERLESATSAALTRQLIPLGRLERGFPREPAATRLAYAQSMLFFRELLQRGGISRIQALLQAVRRGEAFPSAFLRLYGESLDAVERAFVIDLTTGASWVPILTSGGLIWVVATGLFLWSYVRRRRRARATLRRWDAEAEENENPGFFG